jgi:hypothetical protein
MEASRSLSLAGALIITATILTVIANWWIVVGPATQFPVNGYRFPLLDFNQAVDFRDDANSSALILGWKDPVGERDPAGATVWSEQMHATLAFRLPDGPPLTAESSLRLQLRAYLAPPKLATQHISIWEGKNKLAEAVITTSNANIIIPLRDVPLPRDPAPVVLRFDMPDAISPYDLSGSGDDHPLSIGIVSLEVTR